MLGGLTIYHPVANFLLCMCAKNYYEYLLAVDNAMAKIIRLTFLAHPVLTACSTVLLRSHKLLCEWDIAVTVAVRHVPLI